MKYIDSIEAAHEEMTLSQINFFRSVNRISDCAKTQEQNDNEPRHVILDGSIIVAFCFCRSLIIQVILIQILLWNCMVKCNMLVSKTNSE